MISVKRKNLFKYLSIFHQKSVDEQNVYINYKSVFQEILTFSIIFRNDEHFHKQLQWDNRYYCI